MLAGDLAPDALGCVPVMALTARHALDSTIGQAWGTVRRKHSQCKRVGVLSSQAERPVGWAGERLVQSCFTPSAFCCLLYSNRRGWVPTPRWVNTTESMKVVKKYPYILPFTKCRNREGKTISVAIFSSISPYYSNTLGLLTPLQRWVNHECFQ